MSSVTTNPPVELNTIPVGLPDSVLVLDAGIVTTSGLPGGALAPVGLYRVDTPVPLSAIQMVSLGEATMPQGLTRFGSSRCATPGMSETRFVCSNPLCAFANGASPNVIKTASAITPAGECFFFIGCSFYAVA